MSSRPISLNRAYVADALTLARFVLAVLVIPIVAAGAWSAAGAVVATAWWTDFFDGRVARTSRGTRLGDWDHHADTAVGFAVVAGLAGGRHVPAAMLWLVIASLLGVAFLTTRIFALSEMVQALGYAPLLWFVGVDNPIGLIFPLATILAILVMDADRFRTHTLPSFFDGLRTLTAPLRRRRSGL